ncbi:MAG: WD40 repeat domain-containing serine/threonine-protein kinase [Oscillochloridaceae bacterium]|nr:WD40 repeat domain-containing serine/threonine-protein kinase [Chloroflexaceae bacterium]MDW8388485.1 WD40 repeat domain-containing serine/threonine-protein kinase [Oscillochloridaceae bacterium]
MLAPETILNDRYRITYVVEERPDCVLYRAIDAQGSLRVMIAELPQPSESALADARALAEQVARVVAPGLLSLRDHFARDLTYYLVADDPGGQDLDRVARDRGGPLPENEVLNYLDRLLGTLEVLHGHAPPLLIGDLRPTDLWSSLDGGLFLAPFPLVRPLGAEPSPYRAPELNDPRAELTTSSDLYAMGAVLYQLLCGWAPPTSAQRQAGAPLNAPRILNARISALAEQLVLRALEMKPANRYQQAREMRRALDTVRLMAGRPLGASEPAESYRVVPPGSASASVSAPAAGSPAGPIAPAGPPPPAPPPIWTGAPQPGQPVTPQGQVAGWQAAPAAAPPRTAPRLSTGCLVAIVALLTVLALGVCLVGAALAWLLANPGASLPFFSSGGTIATSPAGNAGSASSGTGAQGAAAPTAPSGPLLAESAVFTQTAQLEDASVGAVQFAPGDGPLAVGVGGAIHLRDPESLEARRTLTGHNGDISALAFSPDGQLLASGAQDENEIILWDLSTGQELRRLRGHSGWIRSLAFSPDGRILASGSTDTTIMLWDVSSGRRLRTLEGHTDFLGNIAFSPDGSSLVSASRDGTARLWDVDSGAPRDGFAYTAPTNPATGAPYWLTGIAFSPDGQQLAVGSVSGSVYMLDARTGKLERELQGHEGWVVIRGVSFSPDGRLLASASLDGTVHLWNPASGAERGVLQRQGLRLLGLSWSADSQRIATSSDMSGSVTLWDVNSQEMLQMALLAQGSVTALSYSDSGQALATGGINGSIRVHLLEDGRAIALSGGAPTSQYLSFLSDTQLVVVNDSGKVMVVALTGGVEPRALEGLDGFALSVVVSRDRRLIAAGNERGDVALWDARTFERLRTLRGIGGPVAALAFNRDGSSLVAVTNEPSDRPLLIVWDTQNGQRRSTFSGHGAPVTSIDVAARDDLVASASTDGALKLWRASSGEEVRSLQAGSEQGSYFSLAFSPDASVLATGALSGEVEFWNTATGERLSHFATDGGAVFAIAFRSDGSQVAVATRDRGVFLLEPVE